MKPRSGEGQNGRLKCPMGFLVIYHALGCRTEEHGPILKDLFHTDYFKVNVVKDADTVELCGSLKVF